MANILGIIPARSGSKGIPKKNIKLLGGKPLIAYTIEVAQKSQLLTHLIVSTDDEEIAKVAREFGAEVPFLRPKELASDQTLMLPVIQHAVKFMEEREGVKFDYIATLQPTSPFRLVEDIDSGLKLLIKSGADSVVSLVEVDSNSHPIKIKKLVGNQVLPYCFEEPEGFLRQDFKPAYKRSGALYINCRDLVVKESKFYGDNIAGYILPPERSIDIDDEFDWLKAEYLLEKLKGHGYNF